MIPIYGYLVAIESEKPVPPAIIEQAIQHYLNDSQEYTLGKIEAECMGEISIEPEATR